MYGMSAKLTDKFMIWKGVPREQVDWHPTVDGRKCTGCGMCVTSCGREVFDYDGARKRAVVARPLQCLVGCTSCEAWCVFNAISFTDKQYVRDVIKKSGILMLAKQQLEQTLRQE
jgi:NAD-dependent dihydropyrimidine dehydrogenase PreA subunit